MNKGVDHLCKKESFHVGFEDLRAEIIVSFLKNRNQIRKISEKLSMFQAASLEQDHRSLPGHQDWVREKIPPTLLGTGEEVGKHFSLAQVRFS